ncbi:MAG: hypothetical protein HY360_18600 [Verrucomicrobia bacterium]|nr:hypothetical protein [Verrucomicrobiota bacterium]
MTKPTLPFVCVSKAYSTAGKRQPLEGIRNLARIAHQHRVPVTWIIHDSAARDLRSELAEWHREFGDEVALALMHLPPEAEAYRRRRASLREACPWSRVDVAGIGGGKSARMLSALEGAGFRGLWGYCWEQIYVDGITDYGQPPGMFRASMRSYKMPSQDGAGIVAIEWISRDLNKAFWTTNPVHFSVESDAFLVMGDWDWETSLRYFHHVLGQYHRNARAGQLIPFVFQEEAEQLAPGFINNTYDKVCGRMLEWIDAGFSQLERKQFDFTTLPRLVERFCAKDGRQAQLVRARDRAFPRLHQANRPVFGAELCFPEVAHFTDSKRYATFLTGNPSPIRLIRYDRQQNVDIQTPLRPEPILPSLVELHRTESGWKARIDSIEDCPFALALSFKSNGVVPARCVAMEDLLVWHVNVKAGSQWYQLHHER